VMPLHRSVRGIDIRRRFEPGPCRP
jgi:hypothetical protein